MRESDDKRDDQTDQEISRVKNKDEFTVTSECKLLPSISLCLLMVHSMVGKPDSPECGVG